MYTFLRIGVSAIGGVIGGLLGIWLLKKQHQPHDPVIEFIYIMGGTFIFGLAAALVYSLYVFYLSNNMEHVENLIGRLKSPLYVALRHSLKGEYRQVRTILPKIKNPSTRAYVEGMLLLEEQDVDKAESVINSIKIVSLKNHLLAAIAIAKRDWERFNELKSKLKPGIKFSLEAEEAFRKGDVDRARELGNYAIANSKGLQRYILIKSLERQEKNPDRRSYF